MRPIEGREEERKKRTSRCRQDIYKKRESVCEAPPPSEPVLERKVKYIMEGIVFGFIGS